MTEKTSDPIVVGRIGKPYGVQGWLKVHAYTEPTTNLLQYSPWQLLQHGLWHPHRLVQGRAHGEGLVVQLEGCTSPEAARRFTGCEIAVERTQLPELTDNEYYWIDLIGLTVKNTEGLVLGTLDSLLQTGGHEVLVVKGTREYLIPYIIGKFVLEIDLKTKLILVDWDADF